MDYTDLLIEADSCSLITKEKPLRANDGRIKGNRIAIKKDLPITRKTYLLFRKNVSLPKNSDTTTLLLAIY